MADVHRSTSRHANPVVVTDRAGREVAVERVDEADLTTTDALATFEAGTRPQTDQDLFRQMVDYQRMIVVELRVLTLLMREQTPAWDSLELLRQDMDLEL